VHKSIFLNDLSRFVKGFGALFGGLIGGFLPNFIDPRTWSGHLSAGHGLVPVGLGALEWQHRLDSVQAELRRAVDDKRFPSTNAKPPGSDRGLFAGYLSHVALDFATPCCLPLVC
jgi:hypothetical protein